MTTPALPLQDLAQNIATHVSQLQQLRREFEARQTKLAKLQRRKGELETQLRRLEKDIAGVTRGNGAAASAAPASPPQTPAVAGKTAAAAPPKRKKRRKKGQALPDVLLKLVREAGRPITARELAAELTQRRFPTNSKNFLARVQTRLGELVSKGVLRRVTDEPGSAVVLGNASPERQTPSQKNGSDSKAQAPTASKPANRPSAATREPSKTAPTSRAATSTPAAAPAKASKASPQPRRGSQPSLREVLLQILKRSKRPLSARDLRQRVLESGYQTNSQNFLDVIWTTLGKMDEVESGVEGGFRLKR